MEICQSEKVGTLLLREAVYSFDVWIILSKIEASLIKDFKLDNTTSGSAFICFALRPFLS